MSRPRRAPAFLVVVPLLAIVTLVTLAACTSGGGEPTPTSSTRPTPVVSTGPVRFVPGEFVYEFGGITATLSIEGSVAMMAVRNRSGSELGPPGVYVIDISDTRRDGAVQPAVPIPDGGDASFRVAFPPQVTRRSIGLVILEFGDLNVGAFAPRQAVGPS